MKKLLLIVTVLISLNTYSEDVFYKTAHVKLPNVGILYKDIKVVSLINKGKEGIVVADEGDLEVTTDEMKTGAPYRTLELRYVLEESSYSIKFAVLYKIDEKNYVVLLSKDSKEGVLDEIEEGYAPEEPMKILDGHLDDWDDFPGIELTKDISLSAITVRDTTDNILKEISNDTKKYEGKTGGINPGQGNNEFIIKSQEIEVIDGDKVKDNKKNLDNEGTLGYYYGNYISFKPHKHTTGDRLMLVVDGETKELPNNISTEIDLTNDSKIRVWNSKGNGNGDWYFTIAEGKIDDGGVRVTIVEDKGSSLKETIEVLSLDSDKPYKRRSNVNMINSSEGEVYFDITDIHE